MDPLLALATVLPLLAAAAISALNMLLRGKRRALDAAAILTAAAVAAILAVIMARTAHGDAVYWFAGFRPSHGIAIGIDFAAGPLSAGLACLAAVLVTTAMIFSWRYFERVATYYHVLMLTFLAGMVGFCLTGDIFDLFVWFELMGVSAYALTAYRPEERGSLQGALNFAITNSVGAYLSLSGIAIIYGRTGALNMAQIGAAIARSGPDRLVLVAFVLIITGFLIKGAIVPFHFWLADAHAVAPTPVCVLLSGVMVELGLYGITRVYWSMFGSALGHRSVITGTFLALGVLTAVVGALFCFRERHLKRLLAFSTISHAGMFLTGIALLTPLGLAGSAVYVAGHALVKAALFLCVGIVLHRLGSVNETWLHGRGRRLRVTGVVFTVAGLGLADMPPFALLLGTGWIEESGSSRDGSGQAEASRSRMSDGRAGHLLGTGRRGRTAGGGGRLLRPGRPAQRGPADGGGGLRGNQRDRSGQTTDPAFHDRSGRGARCGRPRRRPAARHRPGRPGGSGAVSGPGRLQRHRPVQCARGPSLGAAPARAHRDHRGGPGDRPRVGCRGVPPRLARPLLAAPAAAAPRLRAGHRPGADHPPLPERGGQRLRDLDRDRRGLRGRNPGVLHPVTTLGHSPKRGLIESRLRTPAQRDRGGEIPEYHLPANDNRPAYRVSVARIMGKTVRVPGMVSVVAVLVGGTLMGPIGALIAIPAAAALRLLLHEFAFRRLDRS